MTANTEAAQTTRSTDPACIPQILVVAEDSACVDREQTPAQVTVNGSLLASASLEVRLADGTERHGQLYARLSLLTEAAREALARRLRELADYLDPNQLPR